MLIRSPKTLDLSRRSLITGVTALSTMALLERRARAQICGPITPPAPAAAAGLTEPYLYDDFNVANTIGSGTATSGYNFFLNGNIGATLANAAVNTTASAGGSFASANGGVLTLNGPNYPGSGNITIMTTPNSTQKSSVPTFGTWFQNVYFDTYCAYNNTYFFNGQWPAFWSNPQVVINSNYNEIDHFEQFGGSPGNFGYPQTQISASGHEWNGNTGAKIADGGGGIGTVSGGVFTAIVADSNYHRYGTRWLKTSATTGTMQFFYDNNPVVTYDRFAAGQSGIIPTGAGGWPGFRELDVGGPLFVMFGGPPGMSFNVDYFGAWGLPS